MLLTLFLESADKLSQDCELALAQNDTEALESAAHEFKGAAYAVKAERIAAVCLELETLARRQAIGEVGDLCLRLKDCVKELHHYLDL
jgi:HPt (histidine-containing phosphotransfer) domain-containing protein